MEMGIDRTPQPPRPIPRSSNPCMLACSVWQWQRAAGNCFRLQVKRDSSKPRRTPFGMFCSHILHKIKVIFSCRLRPNIFRTVLPIPSIVECKCMVCVGCRSGKKLWKVDPFLIPQMRSIECVQSTRISSTLQIEEAINEGYVCSAWT
ncbi:hypothetical protein MUK42_21976 [Musa troglodytarum]|uniref:Uncharacterized protein n=1 Tax=Musa troglodytarum TaxID=320322 RepID=A0A9E7EZQ6_9LILI|nr:hypothetical protein MUK42_21976 [Musa troglodytarum]